MSFTHSQVDQAWERYDDWHGVFSGAEGRAKIEAGTGIGIVDSPVLSWDGLDVERDESRLRDDLDEVMSRVRYRRTVAHWQG